MAALPLDVPVYAVHAMEDEDVPLAMSTSYVEAGASTPVPAQLVTVPGDHFALIDPEAPAYVRCRELVQELLR
jgi:pimeloyl-ACP methyl ester carboxylesterase